MIQTVCDGYRFGRFEVRPRAGLLLRDQERVKIEDLPFQLLVVLLESPGEVVSKETLHSRLWGDRIFGDLDNVLQVAVGKLREALGERAAAAGYIETVRRRGYRFNGEVEAVYPSTATAAVNSALDEVVATSDTTPSSDLDLPAPNKPAEKPDPGSARSMWAVALTLVVFFSVLAVAAFSLYRHLHKPPAIGADPVVFAGFTNRSGDDSYNGLGLAFQVKLEESPYLNLLSEEKFLRQVPDPASASLQQLLHGCASLGGKVLLTGEILVQQPGYEIRTYARGCANGSLVASETTRAQNRDTVLSALDQAANAMRRDLGESDASRQRFNVPVAQATTSSLAALRAFTLGEEKRTNGHEFEAIRDYKMAVDLDPQFALAYARLGTIYSNASEMIQSAEQFKKAFELREHTTDRERLYIAAHFYSISGQNQQTIEAYELWRSLYPRDSLPYDNLALEYLDLGEPTKAAEVARAAVQFDAASSVSQSVLARVYLETGAQPQLQALCNDVQGRKGDSAMLHESCFLLAFLRHDDAAMQGQIQWSRGSAEESEFLDDVAWVAMYQGKLSSGRRLFAQAHQAALVQGFSELAATIDVDEALLEADFGYPREARALAEDAMRLAPDSVGIQASAALALSRSGDMALAESEAAKAAAQAPLNTILKEAQLPSIHAAVQLQRHSPQAAIAALEPVRPYDACSALYLAPAYYRGLAFQEAGDDKQAAAEFRSVIGHRSLMPDSPYIPLAALELGKALRRLGDSAGAAAADREVEDAWKSADPDFLPLRNQQSDRTQPYHGVQNRR